MTDDRRHLPYLVTVALISLVIVAALFLTHQVVEIRLDSADLRHRAGPVVVHHDRCSEDVRGAFLCVTERSPSLQPRWFAIGALTKTHYRVMEGYVRGGVPPWFDVSPDLARRILIDLDRGMVAGRWARREYLGVEGLLSPSSALASGWDRQFVRPGWLRSRVLAEYCGGDGIVIGPAEPAPPAPSGDDPGMAVLVAARRGDVAALAEAPDLGRTCGPGWLPLQEAVSAGRMQTVRWLLERGVDPDSPDGLHWTALHWAAAQGREDIVQVLLEHGAAVDPVNMGSYTPLHLACDRGHTEVVRMLLHAGADLEAKCGLGWTPMTLAAGCGSAEVIRELVSAGGQVAQRDGNGDTPLHWATAQAQHEAIALLLELGADPNAQGTEGTTALQIAVGFNDVESAAILLRHGADPDLSDRWGGTARKKVAGFRPDSEIARLLKAKEPGDR
jgi:ankyrin repeat protein